MPQNDPKNSFIGQQLSTINQQFLKCPKMVQKCKNNYLCNFEGTDIWCDPFRLGFPRLTGTPSPRIYVRTIVQTAIISRKNTNNASIVDFFTSKSCIFE